MRAAQSHLSILALSFIYKSIRERLLLSEFVVLVHRVVDALEHETLDDFHTQVDGRQKLLHVLLAVLAEHPVYLTATRVVVADTHAKSGIVLSDELLDMSQTIVTTIASIRLQAEGTERQGEFVADDEQPLLVYLLLVEPVSHGIAAEVHEGGRLQQENLASLDGSLSHETITLIFKMNIGRFSKSVQYHKSRVVSCSGVFIARVAKTTNQIFVQFEKSKCVSIYGLSIKITQQQRRHQPAVQRAERYVSS